MSLENFPPLEEYDPRRHADGCLPNPEDGKVDQFDHLLSGLEIFDTEVEEDDQHDKSTDRGTFIESLELK